MKPRDANSSTAIWVAVFLAIATLAVFSPVRQNDFINYDDPIYITENPNVQAGLTAQNIKWAFTTSYANFWHPLTWLSVMLDCQLFGTKPSGHHLMAMLWHAVNAVLLFWILRKMTRVLWRSAFVAALFALHPLHVESVAWASERKDLLSTFFGLLSIWAYANYAEKFKVPGSRFKVSYGLALLFFALGLMSKPMLVTLPFVFLLLDVWPLKRVTSDNGSSEHVSRFTFRFVEKIPFFALAAIAAFLAFRMQQQGGAVTSLSSISFMERTKNAFISYWSYIGKTFVPTKLAVHYPYSDWNWMVVAVAAVGLAAVCAAAIWSLRRRPYIFTGWFWFLGTLFPVIGFVQIGNFSMADRFTYLPLIGFFIVLTWGIYELTANWKNQSILLSGGAFVALGASVFLTTEQIRYWQNTETLFAHAVKVADKDFLNHYNLAKRLGELGRVDEAFQHYQRVLELNPNSPEAHNNLAGIFLAQGNIESAISHLKTAATLQPNNAEIHYNLGVAMSNQGRVLEAMDHYRACLKIHPDHIGALHNLAWHLATSTRNEIRNGTEALTLAQRACQLTKFSDARCLDALDAAYAELGKFTEAQAIANQALQLASGSGQANLERAAARRLQMYQANQPFRSQ